MRLLIALGTLLAAAPQNHPLPAPHPARVVWARSPASLAPTSDTVRATTGAGKGTWIGAGIGALGGYMLIGRLCGIGEGSCGTASLIGFALGGIIGAMVGSAMEGDKPAVGPSH